MRLWDMLARLISFVSWDDERGIEAVEYALLGAMLVAIILAINPQFSGNLSDAFTNVADTIAGAVN